MQRVKEESQIIQTTVLESRQAGTEACSHSLTFPAVEEREERKKISPQPRTAVQQTRKNEFPAGKQQNFPKATFASSSWPPPFRPHLICSAIQRSAGILLQEKPGEGCALLAETSLPATARGPEQVRSEGKVAPEQRLL